MACCMVQAVLDQVWVAAGHHDLLLYGACRTQSVSWADNTAAYCTVYAVQNRNSVRHMPHSIDGREQKNAMAYRPLYIYRRSSASSSKIIWPTVVPCIPYYQVPRAAKYDRPFVSARRAFRHCCRVIAERNQVRLAEAYDGLLHDACRTESSQGPWAAKHMVYRTYGICRTRSSAVGRKHDRLLDGAWTVGWMLYSTANASTVNAVRYGGCRTVR